MGHIYPWIRTWSPIQIGVETNNADEPTSDSGLDFDFDSIVGDGKPPIVQDASPPYDHPLSDFDDRPLVLLLGAGGTGKTFELDRLHDAIKMVGRAVQKVRVRNVGSGSELRNELLTDDIRAALSKSEPVYLLIDAIDEAPHVDFIEPLIDEIQRLSIDQRRLLRVRVTSRGSYVNASVGLQIHFERLAVLSDCETTALEIEPLSDKQIALAAEIRGLPEPLQFVNQLNARRLYELGKVPGTLDLLLNLYQADGDLPSTRQEVFEKGLEIRAKDPVDRPSRLDWSADRILHAAGAMSALLILTSRRFIQTADTAGPDDISIPLFDIASLSVFEDVNERDMHLLLQTGLFDGAGAGGGGLVEIKERPFAEYLAARYLSRGPGTNTESVSANDLLAVLATPADPNRGIRPHLLGVAGWVATLLQDVLFDHVLETDPDALLLGDPASLRSDRREVLIQKLINEISRFTLHPYELSRLGLQGLSHPQFENQAAALLDDRGTDEAARRRRLFGILLYGSSRHRSVTNKVIDLARDVKEESHVRLAAIVAVGEVAETYDRALLKDLVSDDANDPYYSLRPALYDAIFPDILSVSELLSSMPIGKFDRQSEMQIDSSLHFYIKREFAPQLSREQLCEAFEYTGRLIFDPSSDGRYHHRHSDLIDLEDALLKQAVHEYGLSSDQRSHGDPPPIVLEHFRAWVRRNALGVRGALSAIWEGSPGLREWLLEVCLCVQPDGSSDLLQEASALFWNDVDMMESMLAGVGEEGKRRLAHLIWSMTQTSEGIEVRIRLLRVPVFRSFAVEQLGISPASWKWKIRRALKKTRAKWKATEAEQRRRHLDAVSRADAMNLDGLSAFREALSKAKSWDELWHFVCRLRRAQINQDWTSIPHWSDLTTDERETIVALADAYLASEAGAQAANAWDRQDRINVLDAPWAALRLLAENNRIADYTRWIPSIVHIAATETGHGDAWRSIAERKWASDSRSSRKTVIKILSSYEPEKRINWSAVAHFAACDRYLLTSLLKRLKSSDTSAVVVESLGRALLNGAKRDRAASVLGEILVSGSPVRAAAAAEVLLETGRASTWLWDRLEKDDDFAELLVDRLSHRRIRDRSTISVDADQLSRLACRALSLFPPDRVPDRPLSGGFTPTKVDNVRMWAYEQLSGLIGAGEYGALSYLVASHPELAYAVVKAKRSWRANIEKTDSVDLRVIVQQLNDFRLRKVDTSQALVKVVMESLSRYQTWLTRDGAVYDLWNEVRAGLLDSTDGGAGKDAPDVIVPKREEQVSDHLARFLIRDMRHVLIRREVRTEKRGRTDIELTVLLPDGAQIRSIVEVKGSWHRYATAVKQELVDRYLQDDQGLVGMHVVFDFYCDAWSRADSRRAKSKARTGSSLQDKLNNARKTLRMDHRVETRVISSPFP